MKDRKIKVYDNGLKLVYKKTKSREAVYFDIRFHSGLKNDPDDKLGLAHFVEHSVGFSNNKYTKPQKNEFRMKLFYANFATSRSGMSFYAYIADEEFEETFAHFINNLTDFNISDEEFENEKKVIKQEILRFRQNLALETSDTISETIYKQKNIRVHSFGTVETVDNITKTDLEEYIKDCFTLSNCQITVYGNVSYCKVKRLIKKYVLSSFPVSSNRKFLKPYEEISYTDYTPKMVVSPSPDEGKSAVRVVHRLHLKDMDRYRTYATSIINSIIETAAREYFRDKYGLSYSQGVAIHAVTSLDKTHQVLNVETRVDCDEKVVKTVLEVLPKFYQALEKYEINDDSVKKAKTTLRIYEKVSPGKNIIQLGERIADCEFAENIYYTDRENKIFNKKKQKISVDYVKDIFKQAFTRKPFIFVISNTKDELPQYEDLCKEIAKNSKWINKI